MARRLPPTKVQPDLAIALDVTFASQRGSIVILPARWAAGRSFLMGHRTSTQRWSSRSRTCAAANELKFQTTCIPGASGTDAYAIQVAREGIPTALLGIAIRQHAFAR